MTSDALFSLALISLFICFVYGPWQWVWTDITRQTMFEKRDQLFDMAVVGKLDFASDEYRTIRTSLEQSIRFAHMMTLPRLMALNISKRRSDQRGAHRSKMALARISDPQTRQEVSAIIDQADRMMICAIAMKSPVVLIFLIPAAAMASIALMIARIFGYRRGNPGSLIRRASAKIGAYVHEEAEATFAV